MIRIIIFFFCAICLQSDLNAQAYRTAGGLRFATGKTIGLTVQQKVMDKMTLEGIFQASTAGGQNSIILLAEQHQKILMKRLNLYYGAGIHMSWYNNKGSNEDGTKLKNPSGLATVAGLELALGQMVVSWDFQPNLNIFGGDQFLQTNTGFSLRYIFVKPKKKKRNWKFWKRG